MIRNYLKIAFRNSLKHSLWSFINVMSLALGIAACLLIFLFIRDERSFDAFHPLEERIYRLTEIQSFPGTNTQKVALSMPGMGPALLRDYAEIEDFSRYWGRGRNVYRVEDRQIVLEKTIAVDSSFLTMFDFSLRQGDASSALSDPNTAVVTKATALKLFGNDMAFGKYIKLDTLLIEITGVIDDVPENSHLQFDLLLSIATFTAQRPSFDTQFGSNYLVTYVLARPGADMAALEKEMPDFLLRCMPPDANTSQDVNDYYKLYFQPLDEVHLATMDVEHDYNNYRKFNGKYLGLFSLIGLLIIIIASVNFMNLITARASHRWKEVGVRKTIGVAKNQLFFQFCTEAALLGFFAFVTGLLLTILAIPIVNSLLDRALSFGYFIKQPQLLLVAGLITIALSILSSIYPAYYLTSFRTVDILRGANLERNKSHFQSALVVIQFGLAIGMIIATIVIVKQLYFIQKKDIGLNKDHIVLVDLNQEANQVYSTLKEEIKRDPNIIGVTASGQRLGNNFHQWGFKFRTDSIQDVTPSNVNVDFDYLDVYEMELVAGRNFSEDRPLDDGRAFIINESFAKEIGVANPIGLAAGHSWYPDDTLGTVIGVVKDFNFNSLHYAINTLAMVVHTDWGYDEMSVKVDGQNIPQAIAHIENTWNALVPSWPFQYTFLDEHFTDLYTSDRQMERVVTIMALLAILIAAMGLFGLAAITTEKRTKEVGIRKVLGASLSNLMFHLSRSFARLVLVSFIIISPIAYILMGKWLQNFVDRIQIGPLIFVISFLLAFLIAMGTVSFHTYRAALSNPVDTLRDD